MMPAILMTRAKTLLLPADLDGVAAASLFEVLSSMIGRDVVIDASHVENIGGLCLQILLAAVSTWKIRWRGSRIQQSVARFRRRSRLFGICPQYFWIGK